MFGSKNEVPPAIPPIMEKEFTLENMEKKPRFEVYLDDGSKILMPLTQIDLETAGKVADILGHCLKNGPSYIDDEGRQVNIPALRVKKVVDLSGSPTEAREMAKRRNTKYASMFIPPPKKE